MNIENDPRWIKLLATQRKNQDKVVRAVSAKRTKLFGSVVMPADDPRVVSLEKPFYDLVASHAEQRRLLAERIERTANARAMRNPQRMVYRSERESMCPTCAAPKGERCHVRGRNEDVLPKPHVLRTKRADTLRRHGV